MVRPFPIASEQAILVGGMGSNIKNSRLARDTQPGHILATKWRVSFALDGPLSVFGPPAQPHPDEYRKLMNPCFCAEYPAQSPEPDPCFCGSRIDPACVTLC